MQGTQPTRHLKGCRSPEEAHNTDQEQANSKDSSNGALPLVYVPAMHDPRCHSPMREF